MLDPLADKLLLVSIYVTLGMQFVIPAWLVILVVSRDVLIVGGVILTWCWESRGDAAAYDQQGQHRGANRSGGNRHFRGAWH